MESIKKVFSSIKWVIQLIQNNFKAMVFLLIVFLIFAPSSTEQTAQNNLTQINLSGPIMEVSDILEKIQSAHEDEKIKGVLFVVDSPGGAVAPSLELAYAIKRLKETKPVIVYAKGTIASGSYYASIWADEIMANPGSMVGSIGVIMQGADLSGIMEKIGIKMQVVKAGKYKQVGTPDRAWEDYEINELNKVIQDTYNMFAQDVANARELDITKRDTYANAHIFTAAQAKEVGLIDSLGVMFDAKNRLATLSGVENPIWNEEDKFDKFLKKISSNVAVTLHTYFPATTLK